MVILRVVFDSVNLNHSSFAQFIEMDIDSPAIQTKLFLQLVPVAGSLTEVQEDVQLCLAD